MKISKISCILISLFGLSSLAKNYEYFNLPVFPATQVKSEDIKDNKKLGTLQKTISQIRPLRYLLDDEIWEHRESLDDAIFDAVGKNTFELKLYGNKIGSEIQTDLNFQFQPSRSIFQYVPPLQEDDTLKDQDPSRYVLLDSLVAKGRFQISGYFLKPFVEGGIAFRKISKENAIRPSPVHEDWKQSLNNVASERMGEHFSWLRKIPLKIIEGAEGATKWTASQFADQEKSEIFFDKILEPIGLPFEIPFNSQYISDSKKMKVGDLLSYSAFVQGGPVLAPNIYFASANLGYVRRSEWNVTIRKEADGKVLLRYQRSFQGVVNFSPLNVGWEIPLWILTYKYRNFSYKIERNHQHVLSWTYRYDLKNPEARRALDQAMKLNMGPTWHDDAGAIEPVVTVESEGRVRRSNRRLQLFSIFNATREKSRSLKTSLVNKDDELLKHYDGVSRHIREASINFFKFHKHDQDERSLFVSSQYAVDQSSVPFVKGGAVPEVAVDQDFLEGDFFTTQEEYKKALETVQLRLGKVIYSEEEMNRQIRDRSPQFIRLSFQLNNTQLKRILTADESNVWESLGVILFEDGSIWKTDFSRKEWKKQNHALHCGEKTQGVMFDSTVKCGAFLARAKRFAKWFQKIRIQQDPLERMRYFLRAHNRLGKWPLFQRLIISLAAPDQDFSYRAEVRGEGLARPMVKEHDPEHIKQNRWYDEFPETNPVPNRLIKKAEVSIDPQSQFYLQWKGDAHLGQDQRLAVWLENQRLRSDIPLAASVINYPNIEDQPEDYYRDSKYIYAARIFDGFKFEPGEDYAVQIRIENSLGQPLSETGEIRFRWPKTTRRDGQETTPQPCRTGREMRDL